MKWGLLHDRPPRPYQTSGRSGGDSVDPEATERDFESVVQEVLSMIPPEQHPDDLVLPDDSPVLRRCNVFQGVSKLIRLHKRSEWLAERKYQDRLERLEARVAKLEPK